MAIYEIGNGCGLSTEAVLASNHKRRRVKSSSSDNSGSNYPPKVPQELHLAVRSNPSRFRPACSEDLLTPVLYL